METALYGISLHAVHQTELTAKLIQKTLVPCWMLGLLTHTTSAKWLRNTADQHTPDRGRSHRHLKLTNAFLGAGDDGVTA